MLIQSRSEDEFLGDALFFKMVITQVTMYVTPVIVGG